MANDMKQKLSKYTKKVNMVVSILVLVVIGSAIFLSTDAGKELSGINLNPFKSGASLGKFRKNSKPIKDQYIVVFKSDVTDVNATTTELNVKHYGQLKHSYENAIKGFATKMTESQAMALSQDPRVEYVEEDGVVEEAATQTNATWGISRIDQRSYSSPPDTNYEYNSTGQGVNVYVIDTGVNLTHPDFGGRALRGINTSGDNTAIEQCNGHGTHVAGTIGSTTFGVAKNVKLYDVRVFPCWGGTATSNVIAGIDWVTRQAIKPAVANLSTGGSYSSTLDQAVKSMNNSGVTAVVAAGNGSHDACSDSPASTSVAITVGMSDERDYKVDISNYGRCVDVFAPGSAIYSTGNIPNYPAIHIMSGTSTAAPHVAGVAALYLSSNPTASTSSVHNAIVAGATPNIMGGDIGSGSPNLLLYSLLSSAPQPPPPPPGPDTITPTVNITAPSNGAVIRKGNVKITTNASDASGISTIVIALDGGIIKTCYDLNICTASVSASSFTPGSHTISVTATDKAATPNSGTTSINVTK